MKTVLVSFILAIFSTAAHSYCNLHDDPYDSMCTPEEEAHRNDPPPTAQQVLVAKIVMGCRGIVHRTFHGANLDDPSVVAALKKSFNHCLDDAAMQMGLPLDFSEYRAPAPNEGPMARQLPPPHPSVPAKGQRQMAVPPQQQVVKPKDLDVVQAEMDLEVKCLLKGDKAAGDADAWSEAHAGLKRLTEKELWALDSKVYKDCMGTQAQTDLIKDPFTRPNFQDRHYKHVVKCGDQARKLIGASKRATLFEQCMATADVFKSDINDQKTAEEKLASRLFFENKDLGYEGDISKIQAAIEIMEAVQKEPTK